jgi:hypothetical protein
MCSVVVVESVHTSTYWYATALLASIVYFYHESCTHYIPSTYFIEKYILGVLGSYFEYKVRTLTEQRNLSSNLVLQYQAWY